VINKLGGFEYMRSQRIAATTAGLLLTLGTVVGAAGVANASTPTAAPHAVTPAVSTAGFKCSSTSSESANYSWGAGTISTTVYNNHCSGVLDVSISGLSVEGQNETACLATPVGKSSKKYDFLVSSIRKGC
jgi:hypothetical protein